MATGYRYESGLIRRDGLTASWLEWLQGEGCRQRVFKKTKHQTSKGTKTCSQLDQEGNFLMCWRVSLKIQPCRMTKESDVAELPICACPTSPREQEEREGGRGRCRHQTHRWQCQHKWQKDRLRLRDSKVNTHSASGAQKRGLTVEQQKMLLLRNKPGMSNKILMGKNKKLTWRALNKI